MADNTNPITDGLKKLLLASVGAVALTAEKADELVGTLVEKGEITVEQGKELNKELKRTYKEHKDGSSAPKDMNDFVSSLSDDDLNKLKEALKDK
ncbi:MAG: aspartyl beta-hydroxylase [Butyrivibrio sp.]|uniref:phasin family protein n=1 Tax=Butyrivibrio sp. TaxID=28121 RepID=UPI0025D796AC|nr:aspartyl beta-hydroxylase [Butyrivibrio sp.]MCR5770221.1 aspartyl beta-hydroxylase [Butyrivibrio sp.]